MNEETMRAISLSILKNAVTLLFQELNLFFESALLRHQGDNHFQV
jgi:hypothetical protein